MSAQVIVTPGGELPVRRFARHMAISRLLLDDEPALRAAIGQLERELRAQAAREGLEVLSLSSQIAAPSFLEGGWELPGPWWHRLIPRRWRPPAQFVKPPHQLLVEARVVPIHRWTAQVVWADIAALAPLSMAEAVFGHIDHHDGVFGALIDAAGIARVDCQGCSRQLWTRERGNVSG